MTYIHTYKSAVRILEAALCGTKDNVILCIPDIFKQSPTRPFIRGKASFQRSYFALLRNYSSLLFIRHLLCHNLPSVDIIKPTDHG